MSKNKRRTNAIQTLTISAMLVALSVLFSSYAKAIPDTYLRFSFENSELKGSERLGKHL